MYRYVNLHEPYERTYGGYWWIAKDGSIQEEGITIQGSPLVCTQDTMMVLNAATAEAGDLHFLDGDIRRTWINGSRTTGLHLFTKLCPDSLVGNWGTYEPVFFRYKPGIMVEDIRRPGYKETFGVKHQIGALTYNTLRAKKSPLELKQTWYIPGPWCLVDLIEMRNLTEETDEAATIGVGMNLRTPINLKRGMLDWYADFHSNGKSGVPMVPRLTDEEYERFSEMVKFQIEYRPNDRCIVARTGCDIRAAKPSYYFACLMLDVPVSGYVLSANGEAQQENLFAADKSYPRQLAARSAVIGLRSESFRLGPKEPHKLKYAIAFGKTGDEAVANARKGLTVSAAKAIQKTDKYGSQRLPTISTGNELLNPLLRYAAITQDINWEPDGRAPGDLGGWGRPSRAEVCGYKNYYDQTDMVVPILDMPVYDPELFKKALLYDVDPQTQRLRKLIIWRQQYDNMLYWPHGVYKVWMATGDDEFLKKMYPALHNTMRWLHETRTEPDGLLRMLTMPYDMFTTYEEREVNIKFSRQPFFSSKGILLFALPPWSIPAGSPVRIQSAISHGCRQ